MKYLNKHLNRRLLLLISLSLMILITACAQQQPKQSAQLPEIITIGVVAPLTGSGSVGGEAVLQGILVAQDEINAKGGIAGKNVTLIIEDTQSSLPTTVTAFQKLITANKVPVVIGGVLSSEAVTIAPIAQQSQIVLFAPTPLTTAIESAGEWVFKLRESTAKHAQKSLEQISNKGHKKIGIISQATEACDDLLQQMDKLYSQFGITVVITEKYNGKDTDMRTQLLKIKDTEVDAIFACGLYNDLGLVFKQKKELAITLPAFSMVALENRKLFEIAGDAAEGVIFPSTKTTCEGLVGVAFCEVYKKRFGKDPDYRASFGYDSLQLVSKAIAEKGYSPKAIQEGLLAIKDYNGATGETSFDAEGNAQKDVIVKQVRGKEFVVIE
ncbi:ABC transporter substrate-binding protein [Candidatus Woesearchaeota archaeon]|nr:ABC transporter substrate-binding protein [Candidatus Woesearchaeota archaeon]